MGRLWLAGSGPSHGFQRFSFGTFLFFGFYIAKVLTAALGA
jgi:hypothetical protein